MTTLRVLSAVLVAVGVAAQPFDSSNLPKEHKQASADLVLPDTANIPGQKLGEWDVDKFFSLWYIFALSDNVQVSNQPYTVLAPSNAAFDRVKLEPGFSGRDHIVRVLRNHIILRDMVTGEALKQLPTGQQLRFTTLLGTQAVFTREGDELYVNGTSIIGDIIEIKNASIIRTVDYLSLPDQLPAASEVELPEFPEDGSGDAPDWNDLDFSPTISPTVPIPLLNEIGEIYNFPPDPLPSSSLHFATENQRLKIPSVGKESFIEAVEDALSLLKSGVSEFQGYFYDVNITSMFSKEKEYTLFLPVNEAFRLFYPIDWGFNPFHVKEFTRDTIINHFVPGKITRKNIEDGMKIKTLGGKELKFEKTSNVISANGRRVFLGDTPISHGNILFLDELLFVDYDIVMELRAQHRDKETAPLLPGMAGEAAFLSHLITLLQNRNAGSEGSYSKFAIYLMNSFQEIALSMHNHREYTIFVVSDAEIMSLLGEDSEREFVLDPMLVNNTFRVNTLLSHLAEERLYLDDLRDGSTVQTLAGGKLKVHVRNGTTFINEARLYPREEHVYNLGNVLFLDSFTTVTTSELRELASIGPEGSGGELLPLPLNFGLEKFESFAGELGSPEGMIRHDGDVFTDDHLLPAEL